MSLQCLIDNPKDLLELIDSCLKPKQKEKQENGEVFTPMNLSLKCWNIWTSNISKKGEVVYSRNPISNGLTQYQAWEIFQWQFI